MTRRSLLYTFIPLIALAGCVKTFTEADRPVRFRFEPVLGMQLRSEDNTEKFPVGENFRVTAYTSSDDVFFKDAEISFDGDAWTSPLLPDWPAGTRLRFTAYSPGNADLTGFCPDTDPSNLMTAGPTQLLENSSNPVPLKFTHALSKIDIRLQNGLTEGAELKVCKVTLDAVHDRGDFSPDNGTWTLTDEAAAMDLFRTDDESDQPGQGVPVSRRYSRIGEERRVIPQNGKATVTIVCALKYPGSEWISNQIWSSGTPINIEWEAGRRYTYSISLLEKGITCTTGISSWDNE